MPAPKKKRTTPKRASSTARKPVVEAKKTPKKHPAKNEQNALLDEIASDMVEEASHEHAEEQSKGDDTVIEVVQGEDDGDITSIYNIEGEDPIDMTTFDQKNNRTKWVVLSIVGAVAIAIIAYLGYLVFRQDFGSDDADLTLTIQVDEKVASGDAVEVVVDYTNNQSVAIVGGEVELFYPDGFRFQSGSEEATDTLNRVFDIEELQPGASARLRVTGQLVGEKDSEKEFSVLATYRPKNFSNDFQESATATTTITSSIVTMNVEVPAQVTSDQEFEYKVTFTNTASVPLEQVKAVLIAPDIYEINSTDPEPDRNDREWLFDLLEPGEEQTVTVDGVLAGKSGKTKELTFQVGLVEIDNSFNVQVEKTSLLIIIDPEVEWMLDVPDVVRHGDEVSIRATLKNASETTIRDVEPVFTFEGNLFDVKDNKTSFDTIEELKPFEEKELIFTTKLKNKGSDAELKVTAGIESVIVEGTHVEIDTTATATMKVGGSMVVVAEGRYFDDNLTRVGSGPLPPIVNAETGYVVYWTITNGLNELSDFSMTTTLPADVIWKKSASKAIAYDAETRQVSFQRDRLAPQAELTVQFEVSISPTEQDLNKLLPLTGETVVTASDQNTDESISETIDRITTDLPSDEGAKGKGVVEAS